MKNGHFTRKVKTKSKDNQTMAITESNIHNAWTLVKQLTNALRYFQDAVEKEIHNQLPGASSILLDIVVSCYTELGAYLINKDRSAKMLSATDRVYLSLAELMKWSDRVLIEESSNYNRDEVSLIVGNLKESVNTLVQLCVDYYQSRDNLVKSSTSFSLKNDEIYDDGNQNDLTDGNTPVKDILNCTNFHSRKSSNTSNHSEFSLSHHRNSLPDMNPLPLSPLSTSLPSTATTNTITVSTHHPFPKSVPSASIPVTEGISKLTDKLTATHIENLEETLHSQNSKIKNLNSSGCYSMAHKSCNNPSSSPSPCSDRFPHSFSSDSLLSSKTIGNIKTVPLNNAIYAFDVPGEGNRERIFENSNFINNNHNKLQETGRSQTSSFASSCVSSSLSSAGVSDYPDLDDIPPPLPPKKKQSMANDLNKSPIKKPTLEYNSTFEALQLDSTRVSSASSSFNCQSTNAMTFETFSSRTLSDRNDLLSGVNHDIPDYRNPQVNNFLPNSGHDTFSSRTTTLTKTFAQKSQQFPIVTQQNCLIHSPDNRGLRSSKDGINNQIDHLNGKILEKSSTIEGESPPEIPVKLRRRYLFPTDSIQSEDPIVRPPSQYDNISDIDSTSTHTSLSSTSNNTRNDRPYKFDWSSTSTWQSSNHSISCPLHLSRQADSISSNGQSTGSNCGETENFYEDFIKPPPLPPKQRNIMTYMTMLNNSEKYDGPNDAVLNLYRHSVHAYHLVNSSSKLNSWQQMETTFNSQRCLKKISSTTTGSDDSILSLESSSETSSTNIAYHRMHGDIDPDLDKPPSLPPKAKSQIHLQLQQINQLHQKQQQQQIILEQSKIKPQKTVQSQFPESPSINQCSIKTDPDIESNEIAPSQPAASSPINLIPSSESGISSQSETTRTTDECQGPLDEIDVSPYLVYKNTDEDGPDIKGGIIDVLIVKATEVSKNDFLFQEAFLTTYRTFINPLELINKLIYRYNKFTNYTDSKQRAAKNSFALLVRVVDDLCVSDCNDLLMQTLLEFIYSLVIKGDLTFARVLRAKVIEKFDNRRNGLTGNQILLPSVNISSRSWSLHNFKSEVVAEQMTLLDAGLFQKVEVAEYLLWAREQKEELIPNLNKFTEHFNKMSYWTRSRIVEIEDPKEREKLVTKFIKIMKHLRKMNNFNSYLALLSALDSAPVRRLEWPKSITESMKDLCSLIDSSSSFRVYRQALAETQPPCIPYIGLILQDLTFVHIGNSDYLPDSAGNNINFAKRWQIFNILDQMRRFKNSHYPFKKNEQVLSFFNDFDNYLSEEAIWQISESIKPRLNNGNSSNNNSSPEKPASNVKK